MTSQNSVGHSWQRGILRHSYVVTLVHLHCHCPQRYGAVAHWV